MLYPLTEKQTSFVDGDSELKDAGTYNDDVWFIKQRIGNACGTIGLLHALMNVDHRQRLEAADGSPCFEKGSWLEEFAKICPSTLDPLSKADKLESDNKIASLHDEATSSDANQTNRGNLDDNIITHFVTLMCAKNMLYELDGRKGGPVSHGQTSRAALLKDACRVVRAFMDRDPGEMRFTILALAPKQG